MKTPILILIAAAVLGGCTPRNPLQAPGSNLVVAPTPGPTPHAARIDDFENTAASSKNFWRGSYLPAEADTLGTSTAFRGFTAAGHSSSYAMRFYGGQGVPGATQPPWPYAVSRLYLDPLDALGSVNAAGYGATGLRFWVMKSVASSPNLRIKIIDKDLLDYTTSTPGGANAYHFHATQIVATNAWVQVSLPYTSFGWGGSWGPDAMASKAGSSVDPAQACAIQFEAVDAGLNNVATAYDFAFDDLEFY